MALPTLPEVLAQLHAALEQLAELRDRHDTVVPDLVLEVQGVRLALSGKRLPAAPPVAPPAVAVLPECRHGYASQDGDCHHPPVPEG